MPLKKKTKKTGGCRKTEKIQGGGGKEDEKIRGGGG